MCAQAMLAGDGFTEDISVQGNYGAEADLWSAGVILYILLSGLPPFYGRSEHEIFAAVRRGNPEYESSGWQTVSPDAKDLVQRWVQGPECCFCMQDPLPGQASDFCSC